MPINKFKFVSPGVQVAEIDNSQLPNEGVGSGPVIIGRAQRGPAMRPVLVNSFSDFVSTFGMPWPGKDTNDIWRNGNQMAPSYGVYAAQAYLRSSSPLTFVRLLGEENAGAGATQALGAAGWQIGTDSTDITAGGNYGLFLFETSSASPTTGTLAAVFYCTGSTVILRGDGIGGTNTSGTCGLIRTRGTSFELQAQIVDSAGAAGVLDTINFNFDPNSQKYIRNVFNTNPTTTNARISAVGGSEATYFLGETYDGMVSRLNPMGDGISQCAMIVRLANLDVSAPSQNTQLRGANPAETGWILSQYLGDNASFEPQNTNKVQRLFKIKSLNAGAWESQNFKISISDVAAPTSLADPYGSFTVEVRKSDDNDNAPEFVERFAPCNLNPTSPNYVARKIGDRYTVWDSGNSRYREYGTYTNNSSYVYVEMAENVTNAMINEALIPFGFDAPPTWDRWTFNSGTLQGAITSQNAYAVGGPTISKRLGSLGGGAIWTDGEDGFTGSIHYPQIQFRSTSKQGSPASPGDAYFGYTTGRSGSYNTYDESNIDVVRPFPSDIDAYGDITTYQTASLLYDGNFVPNVFTLDELEWLDATETNAKWVPGCHVDGDAITVVDGGTWQTVLTKGFDRFTLPFFGGFDGENIVESNPFNSQVCIDNADAETNYAYNSVKMAIDSAADPELVDSNLMAVPGNYCPGLTSHLLSTCEGRADSLAVFELEGGYVPEECDLPTITNGVPDNRGSITDTIAALKARGINSSYGATYYPWVQLRDEQSSQLFYAPPSIAAIGTYSSAQQTSEIWFAPAGFTRGGLTDGDAGLPVVGLTERLNSSDRDTLYEANINPIATFPAEGIVIFGQKTLQVTPSALDRVNVRRLMIHVKKEISKMAARLLFDQNVSQTWARFTGQANPFLESIKQRLGLEAYKVVLDTTTTTPDLIDRNIMYAKIFLKPARAIEFIAIDFVITNAGASFED